jgi:hypothetical protein
MNEGKKKEENSMYNSCSRKLEFRKKDIDYAISCVDPYSFRF